jgi:hypothetical protein
VDRIESKQKIKAKKRKLPERDFHIPDLFTQFTIFLQRNILRKLSNLQYLLITFLEAPLLALICAWFIRYSSELNQSADYVFRENVNLPVYMFIGVIVAMFMSLQGSAREIFQDRKIQERESFLHLSRLSYLHSKILVMFIISAIQTLSFVVVGNLILEIRGMYFHYWFIFFSMSCLANLMGLNLSAGLNSMSTAYIVIPFILVPQLLFSGVMIPYDRLNKLYDNPEYVPLIGELMPSRWAYEAVAVHQFKGNRFGREFFQIDQVSFNASYEIARIQDIEQRLNEIHWSLEGRVPETFEDDMKLIRHELELMSRTRVVASFGPMEGFISSGFNEQAYATAMDSLERARQRYLMQKNYADSVRDARALEMTRIWGGEEAYLGMKRDHTNGRLEDLLVRNTRTFLVPWKDRLVRKIAPVYQEPHSRIGRAHLFAPHKRVGHLSIDTYWFNIMVIWMLTLIFYLTLAYDLLRKIVNWNQIRLLRKNQ